MQNRLILIFSFLAAIGAIFGRVWQYPSDPSIFQSIMKEHQVIPFDSDDKTIDPEISHGSIETAFSRYWDGCKINSIDVVYYLYYAIAFGKEDNTKRIEVLDGMVGYKQEYVATMIPSSFFD